MLKEILKNILNTMGYNIVRCPNRMPFPVDIIEKDFIDIYKKCRPYTLTTAERMYSLYKAVEYTVKHKIIGDMVECGVWKGGSSMLMAYTLLKMNEMKRKIYLYDTYEGMSKPSDFDISTNCDTSAVKKWTDHQREKTKWLYASLEEVRNNLFSTGYPKEKLIFVKGKVEETIPNIVPDKISILRLDTDWFESTYHELCYLFSKLAVNGVIIIDDYGNWKGARQAVDKYFEENRTKILLNRIDYTGRIAIKVL